jgi:hypothetical protein
MVAGDLPLGKAKQGKGGITQGKGVYVLGIRAHFLLPQKTGLSACIFCPVSQAKGYRFYPLREPKPLRGFGWEALQSYKNILI